jgi:hypothetical protein
LCVFLFAFFGVSILSPKKTNFLSNISFLIQNLDKKPRIFFFQEHGHVFFLGTFLKNPVTMI